ncbi:unnamed protein product [Rotaria socialis]|uniref:Uncharacterized protein n=1 Tax=Rotaria socialis TaxID=392032 RepID=A0A818APU0_9BILA|nr:unnamed protein product [Rotaria socialis]CAF4861903.1 unnamed protein product [Rotaria socialis]
MAQPENWNLGRVLIAGDSRVRRLQSSKDPQLSKNVDFIFQGGVLISDLVELVDRNLTAEHKVIIIMGFIGDEIMKYLHPIADNDAITLLRSRESNPSENIIKCVKEAHSKWMALDSNRVIVWTVPYYIDYAVYNSSKMGEFEDEESLAISYDSSVRFVNYIALLRRQWATCIPNIVYSQLNKVLFGERRHAVLFKSFGSTYGEDFKFPTKVLSDGVHPSASMARAIWKFLHASVGVVASKAEVAESVAVVLNTNESVPSTSQGIFPTHVQRGAIRKSDWKGKRDASQKPYSTPRIKVQSYQQPVHSRLVDLRSGEELEELIEEYPVGDFGNISWKASSPNMTPSTSSGRSSRTSKRPGFSSWSWDYHRRVVADAKAACFTKGVVQQIYAEADLADIIRQGGLKTAKEGLIDSISAAQKHWSEKGLAKLNAPHPDAKLIQKDIVELLPTEDSEEEDSDLL